MGGGRWNNAGAIVESDTGCRQVGVTVLYTIFLMAHDPA